MIACEVMVREGLCGRRGGESSVRGEVRIKSMGIFFSFWVRNYSLCNGTTTLLHQGCIQCIQVGRGQSLLEFLLPEFGKRFWLQRRYTYLLYNWYITIMPCLNLSQRMP